MIKAIYFDFDGVLTPDRNDGYTTCQNLSKMTGIPYEKLYAAYSPYLERLYAGKITNRELWDSFCTTIGEKIDFQFLKTALKQTPKNSPLLELAQQLKKNGYFVGIITNQAVDRYNAIKDDFQIENIFDPVVVSARVGCTKRGEFGGTKIFEEALKPHLLKPEECVFIDNSESNLIIPREMGFHIYYHPEEKNDVQAFKNWLSDLGVKVT